MPNDIIFRVGVEANLAKDKVQAGALHIATDQTLGIAKLYYDITSDAVVNNRLNIVPEKVDCGDWSFLPANSIAFAVPAKSLLYTDAYNHYKPANEVRIGDTLYIEGAPDLMEVVDVVPMDEDGNIGITTSAIRTNLKAQEVRYVISNSTDKAQEDD